MNIKFYEDRSYSRDYLQNEGTEYENLATTLYFNFPETVNGVETSTLNKYIVFDINGSPNTDILRPDNSYIIPSAISQLGTVNFNIYLEQRTNNGEDNPFKWISKKVTLNFNEANEMTEIVITAEEIDIFNNLLSELNDAIDEVNNLDIDASKEGSVTTVTITSKDGTQKSVEINDGEDYVITEEDYEAIAEVVEGEIAIPTKVSQLENDSGFINRDVNNLANYTSGTNTGSILDLSIDSSTYVMTIVLKNSNGTAISTESIDLPLEAMIVNATYDSANKKIILTLQNGNTIEVPVGDLVSGLQAEITSDNKLSADLVDDTSATNKFVSASDKTTWNAKYDKPSGGIPSTDLDSSVQTSLGKADTALQTTDIVSSVDSSSTNTKAVGAKLFYDTLGDLETILTTLDIGGGV